ncbi:hypothetical protein [Flavobacterium solisilvae]|uniref:Uncharacterized protein n=1 Tax=Flavobacterium solisilvae TaxID=1852019 RepID=A0ABX1QPQ8_9FLAO|nr:hypothetical protein [Flavobacterium solisilvae]NMH24052.1 hypothetical protein [Flavobacterium solisilvae]
MNTAKEFLIYKLKELHNKFPEIKIYYEHDFDINTHIIEVFPYDVFQSDDYIECEIIIKKEFYDKFPNESLAFVSENSRTRVENPQFILETKPILTVSQVLLENYSYSKETTNLLHFNIKRLLAEYKIDLQLDFEQYLSELKTNTFDYKIDISRNSKLNEFVNNNKALPSFEIEDVEKTELMAA